jgi:hypothetical protein
METPLHPVSLRMTFAEKAKLGRGGDVVVVLYPLAAIRS